MWYHTRRINQEKSTTDGKLCGKNIKKRKYLFMLVILQFHEDKLFSFAWCNTEECKPCWKEVPGKLYSVFKQTLRKSKNKFWIIKKVRGLHNNSLPQQNANGSVAINGNGCLLPGTGLQRLLECDASVSTTGLNTQLSATRAMLTAHKHPVIAVLEEACAHAHKPQLSSLHHFCASSSLLPACWIRSKLQRAEPGWPE